MNRYKAMITETRIVRYECEIWADDLEGAQVQATAGERTAARETGSRTTHRIVHEVTQIHPLTVSEPACSTSTT